MFDDNVAERYALAIERISQINNDCEIKNKSHADYFNKVSAFIMLMDRLKTDVENKAFDDMSLEELKEFSDVFEEDIYDAISMYTCVNKRLTMGAPGKEAMETAIASYKEFLKK